MERAGCVMPLLTLLAAVAAAGDDARPLQAPPRDLADSSDADCNAPAGVANAESIPCWEGLTIPGGSNCTTLCQSGYVPSEASLSCSWDGTLSPGTFECEELPCSAPLSIPNAAPFSCMEGSVVEPGSVSCTPRCQCGYFPSEVALNCSRGELYPETFQCNAVRCVNVIDTPYALAPTGGLGPVQVRCALPCKDPEGLPGWEYLVGYDEVAIAQAPDATSETAPAPAPPTPVGELDASLPAGWCQPRCGPFVVAYAETTPGLERIASGLFGHLPCISVMAWRTSSARSYGASRQSALARADLLVTTHADLAGLPSDELQAAGFNGVVVLVDFGCMGHTVEGQRPEALGGWEGRTLCVGADRKAASQFCGSFLEVPPGALSVAMNCQGALAECLDPLRAEQRVAPTLKDFATRKLMAYVDDDCDPTSEAFFDSVVADTRLTSFGAIEALGRCHGTHPELQREIRQGNLSAELAGYMFVMTFEKSADSNRQCPRFITSMGLDALLQGTIPLAWMPEEGSSVLNSDAVILMPSRDPVASWKWALRTAVEEGLVHKLRAPVLRSHARERWFAWDESVRGVRTQLAREASALADAILQGSPHRRCVDLSKARPALGYLKTS